MFHTERNNKIYSFTKLKNEKDKNRFISIDKFTFE